MLHLMLVVAIAATPQATRTGKTKTGIAYEVTGRGAAIVLITGSNLDRRMWARERDWLAKDHTVIRYDLRAHGQSETATAPFTHVDDLVSVLDELAVKKATLIGLSAGSTIALDFALQQPERIDRIVLVGPAISGYVSKQQLPFAADLIAALQKSDYRKAGEVLLATSVFAVPPESQALVRSMVTENDRLWTVPRDLLKPPSRPAVDRLQEVKVPTLVLLGDKDAFQREQAELLQRSVPGAQLVVIPGGGHLLNLTSPKEFQSAVTAFLNR
jgi:pimeloyl-ACP methyl ester carboxylesterase